MIETSGVDHVVLYVTDVEGSENHAGQGRWLDLRGRGGHRLQLMMRP